MNKVLSVLYGFCSIVSSVIGILVLLANEDKQQGLLWVMFGIILSIKSDTVDEREGKK
jgi:glucose uptake protein GlcU